MTINEARSRCEALAEIAAQNVVCDRVTTASFAARASEANGWNLDAEALRTLLADHARLAGQVERLRNVEAYHLEWKERADKFFKEYDAKVAALERLVERLKAAGLALCKAWLSDDKEGAFAAWDAAVKGE